MSETTLLEPEFLHKLESLSLLTRRLVRGGFRGERRSRSLGRGVEFSDYRSYQAGDDYRYVDWNVYSRLDRLFVKLFSEEEDIDVHLLVDTSRSMTFGQPPKLDYGARVAAALGYIGLVNLDRVGVTTFSGGALRALPPRRGRPQIFHLFDFLAALKGSGTTELGAMIREYVLRTKRRGLVILISDLLDPQGYEEPFKLLRYNHFEPFVIHVLSEEELFPTLSGDLRLVDSENGEAVEVSLDGPALDAYARARDRFLESLEQFCLRHQIDYLRTTTAVSFDDLILRYLRMGGLVT
ncbi:MAG: DUF58 domain-containing protein [Armatimonadetes bacterium]|nr:DUF58 domain-containing protein [Armatimonadota bacterium]